MMNKRELFKNAIELFYKLNKDGNNVTSLILGSYDRFNRADLYFMDYEISYKTQYDDNVINQCKDLNLLLEVGEKISDELKIPFKKEL